MSIEGQGHFFTIYFPGFVCFVLYLAKISGERLQDHWSSGLWFCSVTLVVIARFCSNFHHTITIRHCMFCRKIGAEGSVLQELCHFVSLTERCFCDHF